MLQLNVLGGLSLHLGGRPPPPAALQKRRIGLLAILAVSGRRGISRDRLHAYLWPESDSARSRHALDQLVYATRSALETDPFIAEGGDLRLDPGAVTTDLGLFENALEAKQLENAVNAYGGRLLTGVHFADSRDLESWIDSEASRLEQLYQRTLETLACRSASSGDHAAAISWRRKLSASDPLSSRFAAALIGQLTSAGDSAGAIQYARAYQNLVRTELEVEPDPQIEELVATIARPPVEPPVRKAARPSPAYAPAYAPATPTTPNPAGNRTFSLRRFAFAAIVPMLLIAVFAIVAANPRDRDNPVEAGTRSREARQAYRLGLSAWEDRSKNALDTAVVYFRKAVELDPSYAEAQSGLANAYVMIGYSGYRPGPAMFPKAKAAAQRAISLDSTRAASYAALGMELTWERDFKGAEAAHKKAIELDPSYATAHQWYGILLRILGDIPGSVRETGKAAELDPLSLQIQNNYATFLAAAGQSAAALAHYQKVVGEEPDSSWVRRNPWLLTNMASVYAANGRYTDALRFAERAVEILPRHPRAMTALAGVYRAMGRNADAHTAFDRADTTNPHYAAYRAMFHAAEGQADSAFAWFDRVEDWGIPILISLRGLNRIQSDPRYDSLLVRLGMERR